MKLKKSNSGDVITNRIEEIPTEFIFINSKLRYYYKLYNPATRSHPYYFKNYGASYRSST